MARQYDSETNKTYWINPFKSQAYAQGKNFFKNYPKNNNGVSFQEHAAKAIQYGNYDNFINNLNLTDGALKDFMNNDAFKEKSWTNFQTY